MAQATTGGEPIFNVLVIGKTGAGKSALCNTLSDTNAFLECTAAHGGTHTSQASAVIQYRHCRWRFFDSVGFATPDLEGGEQSIVDIFELCARDGIAHILYLAPGRLSQEEVNCIEVCKDLFGSTDFWKYVTLIRTSYPNYDVAEAVDDDLAAMWVAQNGYMSAVLAQIVDEFDKPRVLHINNQTGAEHGSAWKENRQRAKEITMDHLRSFVTHQSAADFRPFYPPKVVEARARIEARQAEERKQMEAQERLRMVEEQKQRQVNEAAAARRRQEAEVAAQRAINARELAYTTSNVFTVQAVHSTYMMTQSQSSQGHGVNQWAVRDASTRLTQQWIFEEMKGSTTFTIKSASNNNYLGAVCVGKLGYVWACCDRGAVRFTLQRCDTGAVITSLKSLHLLEGKVRIRMRSTHGVLDVYENSRSAGACFLYWASNGGSNQQFFIKACKPVT